jgi:hypothetical protein
MIVEEPLEKNPRSSSRKESKRSRVEIYSLLLAIQIFGALIFVWQALPDFRQVAANPGEQLPNRAFGDLITVGALFVMQTSFWYRQLYVPIPFRRSNLILKLVFLFLGRLSFIFGSALFSVVVFRHLPELSRETDVFLTVKRGIILVACLFALFCTSLEVERLGQAFEETKS